MITRYDRYKPCVDPRHQSADIDSRPQVQHTHADTQNFLTSYPLISNLLIILPPKAEIDIHTRPISFVCAHEPRAGTLSCKTVLNILKMCYRYTVS